MQRDEHDLNHASFDEKDMEQMEERRIKSLEEAGIDENHVLTRAQKHCKTWNSYFGDNITQGRKDADFVLRDQWTAQERGDFTRLFKPAMTFNKLYDRVKKVAGEQRRNKPDLIVRSLNGKIKQKQLDLRADLLRTIAYQSQNDLVYQTAFRSALIMGYGAFQVKLEYESPHSFNKRVRYELIPDPIRCWWDPIAIKPHKGDGNTCGRTHTMSRDEFFATYPYITNPVSFVDPYMLVDFQWQARDTICIGEEYVKEWYPITLLSLSDGTTVTEDEWEEMKKKQKKQDELLEGSIVSSIIQNSMPYVKAKRQTQDYRIMHYLMLRDCIIDFEEWPSKELPILFVDGDSYFIEGQQFTRSFIHEAKDAQRCVNYFNSEIAAEIKNRRREQWLGTADNIKGYEQIWRNPEVQMGILTAQPDPKTGMMPMKQQPWDVSQAIMANAGRAGQDMKEILGFSEQEEAASRDVSGKALRERKMEAGMSTYVYFDNLNQAIEQSGRIVNDLLHLIVGENERHMTLSKADGKSSSVVFNQKDKNGKLKNVLDQGEFDVEIDTGPSFSVQKELALEFLQQTLQAQPQAFNLVADLWAKNLDVQFMPQLVERLKTLVPPAILAKEAGLPPPPPQPNPQQMMMQHQMQMDQQEMQNKTAEVQMKQRQVQLDAQQQQLDQIRMQLDAKEMLSKVHNEKEKNHLSSKKIDVDLVKIAADHLSKNKDREVDLHKHHMDHSQNMIELLHQMSNPSTPKDDAGT